MLDSKGKGKLFLLVSHDEYELPIAVCDTAIELAKYAGVTYQTVYACISQGWQHSKYVKVEYTGEETDD